MNIQRLEMVKLMLERMIAGSWEIASNMPFDEALGEQCHITEFDLSTWRSVDYLATTRNSCGFTACVIGHVCFDEEFRKLGWKWEGSTPVFKDKSHWTGINDFFGFDPAKEWGAAELLFIDDAYQTLDEDGYWAKMKGDDRRNVIDRIDELITLGEAKFVRKNKKLLDWIS